MRMLFISHVETVCDGWGIHGDVVIWADQAKSFLR